MRKKKLTFLFSALLISPIVIANQVQADEQAEKSTEAVTELVRSPETISTENSQTNAQSETASLESVVEANAEKERSIEGDAGKLIETNNTLEELPKSLSVSETSEKLSSLIENPNVVNQNLTRTSRVVW